MPFYTWHESYKNRVLQTWNTRFWCCFINRGIIMTKSRSEEEIRQKSCFQIRQNTIYMYNTNHVLLCVINRVIMPFFLVCCGCDTSYIVSVHIQFQASINTISLLCRGHSWRVRLAKQETLTPSGHLVSPLVCRGPLMSTVVLYCWCHSDGASVFFLYFYIFVTLVPFVLWSW